MAVSILCAPRGLPAVVKKTGKEDSKQFCSMQTAEISRAKAAGHVIYKMAAATTLLYCVLLSQSLWSVGWSAKKSSSSHKAASVVTLDIEHSFDSVHFTKRGTLSVQSLRSSRPSDFDQYPLSAEDQARLLEAAQRGGNYLIRVQTTFSSPLTSDNSTGGSYVYGFTRACLLLESQLEDHITVHGDGGGAVVGVALTTTADECGDSMTLPPRTFTTSVHLHSGEAGPSPDVDGFLQKMAERKAAEQTQDNRSFLQKYWMYILVGLVVFMMMSAGQNAAQQAGGGAS